MSHRAERYAALLPTGVREQGDLLKVPRHWSELELQAHWFAGDFGREFHTTTGDSVRVVQFGTWNREAGPDFTDAAVSIAGGEPLRGPIEFDPDARDWERHGHGGNPAYEPVVLHVFTQRGTAEFFTRTLQHRLVPQVHLDVTQLGGDPPNPLPTAHPGRCSAPLREMSDEKVREVLLGAAHWRLQRKAGALARLAELHGADEAIYQGLAAALGYKNNKLPFTLLAQRLPLRLLLRAREDVEPLLFGVSGFLPARDFERFDGPTRQYLSGIWERWWALRTEYGRFVLGPELWHLGGQRPANHPHRRVAAMARIVQQWAKLKAAREAAEPHALAKFLSGLTHPYWDHHYTLDSAGRSTRMALVGTSRAVEMLSNVFLPWATLERQDAIVRYDALTAPLSNRRVETAALRLFGTEAIRHQLLRSAAMQQGLLQVYEDFCLQDATDCAQCRFPAQLAKW